MLVILCSHPIKKGLRELVGTLTHEEAMQKLIGEEFEKIEGEKDRSSYSRK